jgi:hypothetical protein
MQTNGSTSEQEREKELRRCTGYNQMITSMTDVIDVYVRQANNNDE